MRKTPTLLFSSILVITSIFSGIHFSHSYKAEAQTLPTNVNTTWMTDAQVNSFYSSVAGKSGDDLVGSLHVLIDDHREYYYESDSDRTAYKIIDRNWTLSPLTSAELASFDHAVDMPFIHKLYADYNDNSGTADLFKNDGATRVSFDKEHIWAQSLGLFGRTYGAGSDLHALWPSDINGNQHAHSNYNFAIPTADISEYNNDYGTYVGRNGTITGYSHKVFEPLDQYKGDIARAMFYMPARYYTYVDETHPKLVLVNGSPDPVIASPTQPGQAGDLATLLTWNELDPVDEYEIRRNNLIYNNYQLNRNPFIDHPEWARIAYDTSYSGSGASVAPESSSVGTEQPTDLVSISVTQNPTKINYYQGATLDTTGLVITGTQNDNNTVNISTYTLTINGNSSLLLNSPGVVTVTVTVDSLTTSFNVYVGEKENLVLNPASATISYHADFDTSTITGSFSYTTINGTFNENIINSALSFGVYDTKNIGINPINVTFDNLSTTFNLTVTNNGASTPITVTDDLFISEYVEGSSYNKAIEIYNGTGDTIDLSDYTVVLYTNGSSTGGTPVSLGVGTLANNEVFLITHGSADLSALTTSSDLESTVANFNGDDAFGLFKNGSLIDLIGVIGVDPGDAWTGTASNGDGSALDRTLRRISSVYTPNSTFTWSEWEVYPQDTVSDIGIHTFAGTSQDLEQYYLEQAQAYAQFFLDETAPYCSILDGGSSPWSYFQTEYAYMSDEVKYLFYNEVVDSTIIAAKARYEFLINKYGFTAFIDDGAGNVLNTLPAPDFQIAMQNGKYIVLIATFLFVGLAFNYFRRKKIRS